mmetsp:Transcript_16289/g.63504  ORF Transcript_16289/g.63504 Transcript_16289/m.63504 type:complete len:539 (-) Transcript_16289:181-1797(-)
MPPTNNHKENTPNEVAFPGVLAELNNGACDGQEAVPRESASRSRSRSGGKRLSGERDADNFPPHSRLFVVCGRHTDERELASEFEAYGDVEYCKAIRDKNTHESKGLCYVKFKKASAAAAAVEEMDGRCLYEHSAPIRVQVADAKGTNGRAGKKLQYSKEPEDTPARSRLFVVCPKEMTEAQMTEYFAQFEGLEYCKVITDKMTGDSKGFAYVKFNKASSAALAMEAVHDSGCIQNMKVKVLIADPKVKKADAHPAADMSRMMHAQLPMMVSPPQYGPGPYGMPPAYYPPYMGTTYYAVQEPRLFVICHKSATQEQLTEVFNRVPGLESCVLGTTEEGESRGFAHVTYSSMAAASEAAALLDGSEFPRGWTLNVRFEPDVAGTPPNSPPGPLLWSPVSPPQMAYPPHPMMGVVPQQPPAMGELFPVCEPRVSFTFTGPALAEESVQEIFSRFGPMEFYRMDSDNTGTVGYTSQNCAFAAQAELNGTEMLGGVLYVMVMQSMPMPPHAQMSPYQLSMSPPGYAMPPGPMMVQTQFPLEW